MSRSIVIKNGLDGFGTRDLRVEISSFIPLAMTQEHLKALDTKGLRDHSMVRCLLQNSHSRLEEPYNLSSPQSIFTLSCSLSPTDLNALMMNQSRRCRQGTPDLGH